jgi:hypothetical protein
MHVEPADVVADGRRLERRQRRRVVLASVAALALLGGGVGVFDARNVDHTAPASAVGPGTVTVALNKDLFSFRLSSGGRVHFGRVVQGTSRIVSETAATAVNGQAWVVVKDRPNVVLGIAPTIDMEEPHVDVVVGYSNSGFSGSDENLGRGLKAYVLEFTNGQDAAGFRGRVFVDPQGRVRGPGGVLPVTTFPSADESGQGGVWVDPRTKTFGLMKRGSLSMRVDALTSTGSAAQVPDDTATTGGVTRRFYGVLPAGSSRVDVEFTPDVDVLAPLRTQALGKDWVALYTEYRAPTDAQVLGTVVWRDGSGKEHTAEAS